MKGHFFAKVHAVAGVGRTGGLVASVQLGNKFALRRRSATEQA